MKAILTATIFIAFVALPSLSIAQDTGAPRMMNLWNLPELHPGITAFGTSSFDRSGLNIDGWIGASSRLYYDWDRGEHVLFDAPGPGCLYRMWFTFALPAENAELRIYLDDEADALVAVNIHDFFDDAQAPFLSPLVWDEAESSGGFVSYVPICYQDRLMVTTSSTITYYNFSAHRYWAETAVESFTGSEDYSILNELYDPAFAGNDPKSADDIEYQRETFHVEQSESAILFSTEIPGIIGSIHLTPGEMTESVLNNVFLRAFFDGADQAQVDVPLGVFFGADAPGFEVTSLMVGNLDGVLYCYFPMPFFSQAIIELYNASDQSIEVESEIGIRNTPPIDHDGIFKTEYRVSEPTMLGQDHIFVDKTGQGKIVGIVQISGGGSGLTFLEGDERWYPDGVKTPLIHGTGTEDYYNGGWYFNHGIFSLPTHGYPLDRQHDGMSYAGMYRLHLGDSLDFYNGAIFSIEHDSVNKATDESYKSCAFLYHIDEPALVPETVFDIGDEAQEECFQYMGTDDEPTGENTFFYEGDHDFTRFSDSGYRSRERSSFMVRINPYNDGVRLVRRIDQLLGREKVRVLIDDQDAGLWHTPNWNPIKRWRDTLFDIPSSFTKGKSRIAVTLINENSPQGFTHYRYWVFSWKKAIISRLKDLELSTEKTELHAGKETELRVTGRSLSGNVVDVAGWMNYELSDTSLADIRYGRLIAQKPGTLTVTAVWEGLHSNSLNLTISPAEQGDQLGDEHLYDDGGEPADSAPSDGDDESNETGCGC